MSFQASNPSILLSPYIKQYWAIEDNITPGKNHIQRIIPSGLMELIFYLDNKPDTNNKNRQIRENTLISGQQKEFYDLSISGKLSIFSIVFNPYGLMMFFDIPLNELYNQNVPLKNIIGNDVNKLETMMFEAKLFKEKVNIAESFLISRLQKSCKEYEFKRISNSIAIINHSKGMTNVNYLASEACLGRKQYERTFSEFIGTSPKQFLKTIRFQNAIYERNRNQHANLTTLAYNCGYYDQSHMINDFKNFAGMTVRQYFSRHLAYSDYFQ